MDVPLTPFTARTPDGLTLAAWAGGDPAGPVVVFLHGFAQCSRCWSRQTAGAPAGRYRLIAFDARGHGASDKPGDPDAYRDDRRWAGDLAAVLDAAGAGRAVLVGWSAGGRAIVDYLAVHGDGRVAGVVFVAAYLSPDRALAGPGARTLGRLLADDPAAAAEGARAFVRALTAAPLPPDETAALVDCALGTPLPARRALLGRPLDAEPVLRGLGVPALFVHGGQDAMFRPEMSIRAAEWMAAASVSLYDEAGHMPFREAPERFNAELAAFVHRCAARPAV
jgi:pimeloyl-ACP methyl ester carboxylesterase